MAEFRYAGFDQNGERVQGTLTAASEHEALARLASLGIDPISIREGRGGLGLSLGQKKMSRKDLITFTFQAEQLLSAGIPLLTVLQSLQESFEQQHVKDLLSLIVEDMQNGMTFSEALSKHPQTFSPVYVYLVQVGEKTGRLEAILRNLADMLKWEDELASKAKKIMIYPAIVFAVVVGVVIIMMLFVVPQLVVFIKDMGGELGLATTSLMATSEFVQEHLLAILLSPLVIVMIFRYFYRRHEGFRLKADCALLKIPLVGEIAYKLKLARLANGLGVMYGSGIPFTEGMKLVQRTLNSRCLEIRLEKAHDLIQEGMPIHEAFRESEVLPNLATHMLKAGEDSGRMEEALANISYFFDRDAKELIEKLEPAIEPILTLFLAGILLWIMAAVLGPVYDTISQLQ